MKKRWGLLSLSSHLGIAVFFCLKSSPKSPEKPTIVKILSKKEAEKLFRQLQIASTEKSSKKIPKNTQKKFLSDKDNTTDQNTRTKKTDKFIEGDSEFAPAPKSITQKGKYSPDDKQGKGVSATDDFIDGAVIGPKTLLNTQAFKFSNYYNRIKDRVVENWRPFIRKAIKLVKADEKKYGILEVGLKITKLEVKLNAKGEILEINLLQSSGYKHFDEAASNSFRKSAPFSGPPKDLIKDGTFTLRWDFVVNVEAAGLVEFRADQVQ